MLLQFQHGASVSVSISCWTACWPCSLFLACATVAAWLQVIEDYHSTVLGQKSTASRHTRFASFPPVLVIALKRYYVAGTDWVTKQQMVGR